MADRIVEIRLGLSEALAALADPPSDEMLRLCASTFLIPTEYQLVRSRGCSSCGGHDLTLLMQKALTGYGHPDASAWPHTGPAGDSLTFVCKDCGGRTEFVFWFVE